MSSAFDDLPDELRDEVFARFSGAALFRSLSVCKQWRRILSARHDVRMARRCLVLCCAHLSVAWQLDFTSKEWSQIPLDLEDMEPPLQMAINATHRFCGTAGGLFFVEVMTHMPAKIYVCDPTSRSFDVLPDRLYLSWRHTVPVECLAGSLKGGQQTAILVADKAPGHTCLQYKIVALDVVSFSVQMFDTCTSTWTHVANLTKSMCRPYALACEVVMLGYGDLIFFGQIGMLYMLDLRKEGSKKPKHRLWSSIHLPMDQSDVSNVNYRLLRCGDDRILLVGRPSLAVDLLHVWELNLQHYTWKLLTTMPRHFQEESTHTDPYQTIRCASVGDRVCFYGLFKLCVFEYHVLHNSWSWLPPLKCPLLEQQIAKFSLGFIQIGWFFKALEFEPSRASDFFPL